MLIKQRAISMIFTYNEQKMDKNRIDWRDKFGNALDLLNEAIHFVKEVINITKLKQHLSISFI